MIDKPTKSGPTVDIDILCLVTNCFFDRLLRHLEHEMHIEKIGSIQDRLVKVVV